MTAASHLVGVLRVAMGLDSAQFEKGVKRTKRSAGSLEKSISTMAKRVTVAVGGIASISTIRATQNLIDGQAKLAQSLNTSVVGLQNLYRSGELAGVAMSGIDQSTKDLQRRLSQAAAGGGPASDALERLRLSATNLLSLDLDDRVALINQRILEFVPAAQRAAVAGQLFGEEGSTAMLRIDPATIRQATQDIRDFGVAVSEQDADQIERMNDAISRMGLAWTGIKNQLAVSVAPVFEALANVVSSVAISLNKARERLSEMTAVTERMVPYAIALGVALKGGVVVGLVKAATASILAIGKNIAHTASLLGVRLAATRVGAAMGMQAVTTTKAAAATRLLTRRLRFLKVAMISTAIGALVVAAGELLAFMYKLIKGAGGVGNAFRILGDIGREAFERLKLGVQLFKLEALAQFDLLSQRISHFFTKMENQTLIGVARSTAVFYDMSGSFAMVMSDMLEPVKGFINPMIGSFVGAFKAVREVWGHLPAVFRNIGKKAVNGIIESLEGALGGISEFLNNIPGVDIPPPNFDSWKFTEIEELGNLTERVGAVARDALGADYVGALGKIGEQGVETAAQLRKTADTLEEINNIPPPDFTSEYSAQAAAISDALSLPWESVEALRSALRGGVEDFEDLGDAASVAGAVASDAIEDTKTSAKAAVEKVGDVTQKMNGLVDALADSFGKWVVGGFRDFKGMLRSMLGSFKSTIAQMISMAAANQIKVAIGASVMGAATAAAGGAALGGLAKGVGAGIAGSLGLKGIGAGISSALGLSGAGVTGMKLLGTQIGAIAGPILAVTAAISFFKKKTKVIDLGLNIAVDRLDAVVEQFKTIKTTRFFGLSKKVSTSLEAAADEVANPIKELVATMQGDIANAAASLNVGASVFDDFTASIKLSTKGLSDDQITQRLNEEIIKLGDSFAAMIPDLEDFSANGEGARATLNRLASSLDAVNNMSAYLGNGLREMSLIGAGYASQMIEAFGSVEGYMQAHSNYVQTFFSQSEQLQMLSGDLSRSFEGLGIALPETKAAFRDMVEDQQAAIDAALASGNADAIAAAQERYADILNLGPKFAEWRSGIESAFSSINDGVNRLLGLTENGASLQMDAARDIIRRAAETGNVGANFDAAVQAATNISADQFGSLAGFNRARMETAALLNQIKYAQSGQLVQDYALVSQPILPPAIADGTGYGSETLADDLTGRGVVDSLKEMLSSQEISTATGARVERVLRDILDVLEDQSA